MKPETRREDSCSQERPLLPKSLYRFRAPMKNGDFGNGRFARNLFEKAVMKQASRLVAMDVDNVTGEDIEPLVAEDFEVPAVKVQERKAIGFGMSTPGMVVFLDNFCYNAFCGQGSEKL